MMDNKKFMAAGIIIAIIIGVVAVFLASGDPDGLESTALVVQDEKTLMGASPEDGDAEAIGSFITFGLIAEVTWAITSKASKS